MKELKVLRSTVHNEQPGKYVIASGFEECLLTDTYDNYGQMYSHSDAGNYVEATKEQVISALMIFGLTSAKANNIFFNIKGSDQPSVFVEAYSDEWLYDLLIKHKGLHTEGPGVTCKTYYDGHNFRSIIIEAEIDMILQWEEAPEEESRLILEAWDRSEEFTDLGYGKRYKDPSTGGIFDKSYCASDWATACIQFFPVIQDEDSI